MNIDLGKQVREGTIWVILERVIIRVISLIRLPLLAYFLSPDDFGLMSIVKTTLLFVDVATRTGFQPALIQKKENVESYIDVGWTLSFLVRGLQAILIVILLKPISYFFDEPILESLFLVLAVSVIIKGAKSGKFVLLLRELKMEKVAKYNVLTSALSLIPTVIAAYYLRNVWALAIGLLVRELLGLVLSYYFAPYSPLFEINLPKAKELWSFGKWVLLSGIFLTLFMHGDDLFIGKILGVTALGYYSMAYSLGNMVTTELVDALRNVFFPAFSLIQDNLDRLRNAFLTSYQITSAIGGLFVAVMFLLAPEIVSVFLGDKWLAVIPPLKILSIWGGVQMLSTSVAPLFRAVGRPDWWTKIQGLKLVILAVLIYPFSVWWDISGTAYAVLIASVIEIPLGLSWVRQTLKSSWKDILKILLTPVVGIVICSLLYNTTGLFSQMGDIIKLLLSLPVIILIYGLLIVVLDRILKTGLVNKMFSLIKS